MFSFFFLSKRLSMQLLDEREIGFKCCFQMAFGVEFLANFSKVWSRLFRKGTRETSHSWPYMHLDNYRTSHKDKIFTWFVSSEVLCALIVAHIYCIQFKFKLMGISYTLLMFPCTFITSNAFYKNYVNLI